MQWQWTNMLVPWQWAVLGAVPPAILSLYFLKLKRQPLEVPSTYLWRRTVEDLHVNSIWQRLRKNLLLLLQLLIVALAMLALLGPTWESSRLSGGRYIFLIDQSASMSATDGDPARLDEAKRQVTALVEQMAGGDQAMIVAFSDVAQVQQTYTDDRRRLTDRIAAIGPTERRTSLAEALTVSAGLANPGSSAFEDSDAAVADARPARLLMFTDGRFEDVKDFALQNLYASEATKPIFVPLGQRTTRNLAIVSFGVDSGGPQTAALEAFVGVENFSSAAVQFQIELYVDDQLADVQQASLAAEARGGVAFDLGEFNSGRLQAKLSQFAAVDGSNFDDALAVDNQAWAVVEPSRRVKALVVTSGNHVLEQALSTDSVKKLADVTIEPPSRLTDEAIQKQAADGSWDLIVYDRCAPPVDDDPKHPLLKMPQADTLFIGELPPAANDRFTAGPLARMAQAIDSNEEHPLMRWVDMGGVVFDRVRPLTLAKDRGVRGLVESTAGTILAIAPRGPFEDAVLSAEIVVDVDGEAHSNTNWWRRPSFPVFVGRVLSYLGGTASRWRQQTIRPGDPVELTSSTPGDQLFVIAPDGRRTTVSRGPLGTFPFTDADQTGIYRVEQKEAPVRHFAVNLMDRAESDVRLANGGAGGEPAIRIGYEEIAAEANWEPARGKAWKLLLIAGLVVAALEWYIYNRRVYI